MIHDEKEYIRELSWRRILKARRSAPDYVRVFKVPTLNFNAQSYYDMVDWQSLDLTEPPLTKNIETENIMKFIHLRDAPKFHAKAIPCHTQAVERHIKHVMEASQKICGRSNRDGFIQSTLLSRQQMPRFETKINLAHK